MFLLPSKKLKIEYKKKIKRIEDSYQKEIRRLKEKVNNLQGELGDPRYVLQNLLSQDISSYDWEGLKDKKVKAEYAQNAKSILLNPVFKNEINSLYGDLVKEIAMESQNFGIVRDLRMTISGIKLIEERLEKIGVPNKPKKDHPFKEV